MLRSSVKSLVNGHRLCLLQLHNGSTLVNQLSQQDTNSIRSLSRFTKINKATYVASENLRFLHAGSTTLSQDTLEKTLHRLDFEIRRTGRINRREIEEIMADVRQINSITSNQSLMIIRCCGELVPEETFENRTKLVQEVWKTMEKLKVPMDISHYNALLRVYLENEHKFNPTEFLQDLSSKGIEANRVTYQRLIQRFCQDGDIEGASTILQHMKEKQLPINVHVFNALILGHAQGNDMESAEGILGVMKQAGLEPSDDSYVTLMRGYAKNGDLENVKRIIRECEEKEVFLVDRDFLEVIFTLASSKHADLVKEIMPLLKRHSGFNQEATNVILRLVTIGQEDVALELLKEMPRPMRDDEPAPSGNFLIRQLVASDTPPEKVIKICHDLMHLNLNSHALVRACEFSLQLKQFEKTFDFLEALKESGFPIRQHYFWPLFASSRSEKDVYDGLKCMAYLDISPGVETLRDYIIPALLNTSAKSNESFEFILDKLSNYTKISSATIVPAALQYILQAGQLDVAAEFALKYRVKFTHVGIRRALIDAYLKSNDPKAFVQIVGSAGLDGDDSAREAMGTVLMDLLETTKRQKVPLLLPILKECLANGLGLSNSSLEWIQNNLGEELTPEISNLILQLTSGDLSLNSTLYTSTPRGMVSYDERSIPELEDLLQIAKEKGKPTKGIRKALLISHCRERNLEKAEALYEELRKDNFVYTVGIYALLLDAYSHANNLEKCKEFYQHIVSRDFFVLDDIKLLRYALVLVSHGHVDDGIQVLKSQARDEARIPQGVQQATVVWKILNILAEKGDVDKIKETFMVLKNRGLTPISNVVLGPLVKVYLIKDDLVGALKEFETCVNEYSVTPWKQELFCRFIKNDDAESLQKVLDLSIKLHGEVNSLYDLVFAFLECGKIRQAKKILDTPGFRARNEKLEHTCQYYLEEKRTEELERLIEITRDVFNVDRNTMYFYLLKAYCKEGDANKALSVWTSLQEENIQPSDELMIYLANFLKENNAEVPFVVPELKPILLSKSSTENLAESKGKFRPPHPLNQHSHQLHALLENNQLDDALELCHKLESQGTSLTITDTSALILRMAQAERLSEATRLMEQMFQTDRHPKPRVIRYLVGRLAAAGEVDTLTKLDSLLNADLKRSAMLNSRLCVAHVESGRGKDYFEKYIKERVLNQELSAQEIKDANDMIPVSASLHLLHQHADLLPEFEKLASETVKNKTNKLNLHNVIWMHHLINHNYDKAKEVFDLHLKPGGESERVKFNSVVTQARLQKDTEVLSELETQVLPLASISSADKGVLISGKIDILCRIGKSSEALQFLNSHLGKSIQMADLLYSVIYKLKLDLEANNINFPHVLPNKPRARGSRRRRKIESSDSSDSDSD